jgi:hypothetical protein
MSFPEGPFRIGGSAESALQRDRNVGLLHVAAVRLTKRNAGFCK